MIVCNKCRFVENKNLLWVQCVVQWQGIYIIPLHVEMMDYCHAPTPYLIGVHSSIYARLLEEVGTSIMDDGISIFDIDSKVKSSDLLALDVLARHFTVRPRTKI